MLEIVFFFFFFESQLPWKQPLVFWIQLLLMMMFILPSDKPSHLFSEGRSANLIIHLFWKIKVDKDLRMAVCSLHMFYISADVVRGRVWCGVVENWCCWRICWAQLRSELNVINCLGWNDFFRIQQILSWCTAGWFFRQSVNLVKNQSVCQYRSLVKSKSHDNDCLARLCS